MKAWLVVLVLALAGCSSPDPNPDEPNPSSPNPPPTNPKEPTGPVNFLLGFDFKECKIAWGSANAPDLSEHLPEGYLQAEPFLSVLVAQCGNFTTPSAYVANTWLGMIGVEIEDPGLGGSGREFYLIEMMANEDVLGQLWQIAGFDTIVRNATFPEPQQNIILGTDNACFGNNCIHSVENGLLLPQRILGLLPDAPTIPNEFTWYQETAGYRLQWSGSTTLTDETEYEANFELPDSAANGDHEQGFVWLATGSFDGNDLIGHYP